MKDFFAAGSETTSTTMGWALYFMLKHPEVQTKIRVSGGKNTSLFLGPYHVSQYLFKFICNDVWNVDANRPSYMK